MKLETINENCVDNKTIKDGDIAPWSIWKDLNKKKRNRNKGKEQYFLNGEERQAFAFFPTAFAPSALRPCVCWIIANFGLSWILSDHFHPLSTTFIHFQALSPILIPFHSVPSISSHFVHFHPFSSTFIHFLSTFIQFHLKLLSFCCKIVCVWKTIYYRIKWRRLSGNSDSNEGTFVFFLCSESLYFQCNFLMLRIMWQQFYPQYQQFQTLPTDGTVCTTRCVLLLWMQLIRLDLFQLDQLY